MLRSHVRWLHKKTKFQKRHQDHKVTTNELNNICRCLRFIYKFTCTNACWFKVALWSKIQNIQIAVQRFRGALWTFLFTVWSFVIASTEDRNWRIHIVTTLIIWTTFFFLWCWNHSSILWDLNTWKRRERHTKLQILIMKLPEMNQRLQKSTRDMGWLEVLVKHRGYEPLTFVMDFSFWLYFGWFM